MTNPINTNIIPFLHPPTRSALYYIVAHGLKSYSVGCARHGHCWLAQRADARLPCGLWRSMYYSITEDAGMLGVSYGVEFCVVGLDREWSYQPDCRRAQP